MQRMVLAVLLAMFVLGAAVYAAPEPGGNVVPWKAGGGDAEPAGDGAAVDLKTALTPALYSTLIKPIEAKLEPVTKTQEAYDKEMQKAVDKRNERLLIALKERIATAYLGAALAAKQSVARAHEDNIKSAIKTQYQDPNEQKAIAIFEELAPQAYEAGDVRTAIALYKRILQIDTDNAGAKEALIRIAQDIKSGTVPGQAKPTDTPKPKSHERDD